MAEIETIADIIRQAAESEILPRFRNLTHDQIWEKAPGQIVTEADTAAEHFLHRHLTAVRPGTLVGEEATAADPSLLDALGRDPVVWVVDPVDGTRNFSKGNPRFAVIVALVVDGETIAGWIYDPLAERMVWAEKGKGAWMQVGRMETGGMQTRLGVSSPTSLGAMKGSAHFKSPLQSHVAQVGRRGSTAHDYVDLVSGQLDFAHFNRLYPWDHAAGILIHGEAGGYSARMDGSRYRPRGVDETGVLAAPGYDSWAALGRVLCGT
jgi:fructose-1,6-bisphosphatase/inositol monophosphatase family enzyme